MLLMAVVEFRRTKVAGSTAVESHHSVDMFDSSRDGETRIGGDGTNCCGMSAGVSGSQEAHGVIGILTDPWWCVRHGTEGGMGVSSQLWAQAVEFVVVYSGEG